MKSVWIVPRLFTDCAYLVFYRYFLIDFFCSVPSRAVVSKVAFYSILSTGQAEVRVIVSRTFRERREINVL